MLYAMGQIAIFTPI